MRIIFGILLVAILASYGLFAQNAETAKKKGSTQGTPAKAAKASPSNKKASDKTALKKTAPSAPIVKTAGAAKPGTKKPVLPVAHRSGQSQPTSDRYREIQQALSDRGYFGGAPDGNWGPESVDALKRFQREQNLNDDGKIGSLSLIALGLGPKRVAISTAPKPESSVASPEPAP